MKWSWKQKRWSGDHECTNLINILLFVPLILRLVKNLLLLLWLLEAKCELFSPLSHLPSLPLLGRPKYKEFPGFQNQQRPTSSGLLWQSPKQTTEIHPDGRYMYPSIFLPQKASSYLCLLCSPPLFPIYPFLSLGGATALSPRLTRRSALALCNPANPISLATRTKELNDTAPSQWSRRQTEREKWHKFLRIHGRLASICAFSLSFRVLCHTSPTATLSPSCKRAQNGLEMASMGWDVLPIDLEGVRYCSSEWKTLDTASVLMPSVDAGVTPTSWLLLSPVWFHPKPRLSFNHWSRLGLLCGSFVLSLRNKSGLKCSKVALYWSGAKGG